MARQRANTPRGAGRTNLKGLLWLACVWLTIAGVARAEQYQLKRAVVRLQLRGSAPVRVSCTVRDETTGYVDVAVWDPEERRSNLRYALVPSKSPAPPALSISCRSEAMELRAEDGPSLLVRYDNDGEVRVTSAAAASLVLTEQITGLAKAPPAPHQFSIDAQLVTAPAEREAVLVQQTGAVQGTQLRSFDPTAVMNNGLAALAAIALDRASTAGQSYAVKLVLEVCSGLTVKALRERIADAPLTKAVIQLGWADDRRILKNACSLLEGTRLEDLITEPQTLWKAIAADATVLSSATLETTLFSESDASQLADLVKATAGLLASAITGGTPATERDAQTLVLSLGRIAESAPTLQQTEALALKELGLATLGRCLSRGACTPPSRKELSDDITISLRGITTCNEAKQSRAALVEQATGDITGLSALVTLDRAIAANACNVAALAGQTQAAAAEMKAALAPVHKSAAKARFEAAQKWTEVNRERTSLLLARESSKVARALGLGMAVLGVCLQGGECAADELERLLFQELKLNGDPGLLADWPGFQPLLARAAGVLRPAPGTVPKVIAADAVAVVLDVIQHVTERRLALVANQYAGLTTSLSQWDERLRELNLGEARGKIGAPRDGDESGQEAEAINRKLAPFRALFRAADEEKTTVEMSLMMVRLLRGVAASIRGEGGLSPLSELRNVFSELAFRPGCDSQRQAGEKRCKLPITDAQLRRAFKVLAALVTYGASYRQEEGAEGDPAAREKARAEQRRDALEGLIDAVTDRSDRSGEWVVGLGANVAFSAEGRKPVTGEDRALYFNKMPLGLRTGFSVQRLPGENSTWLFDSGLHLGLTFLDLAQYVAVRQKDGESDIPDPEPATAIRIGLEAAWLLGEPSYPVAISAHGGYVPSVTYGDDRKSSQWVFGVSTGVFVPFFDFN